VGKGTQTDTEKGGKQKVSISTKKKSWRKKGHRQRPKEGGNCIQEEGALKWEEGKNLLQGGRVLSEGNCEKKGRKCRCRGCDLDGESKETMTTGTINVTGRKYL